MLIFEALRKKPAVADDKNETKPEIEEDPAKEVLEELGEVVVLQPGDAESIRAHLAQLAKEA